MFAAMHKRREYRADDLTIDACPLGMAASFDLCRNDGYLFYQRNVKSGVSCVNLSMDVYMVR